MQFDLNLDIEYDHERKYNIDEMFLENIASKGLNRENVYLYYQGHAIADRIIPLAKDLVNKLSFIAKDEIIACCISRGADFTQFVREYFNKRQEVEVILRSRNTYPEDQCYALLKQDISEYKRKYCA